MLLQRRLCIVDGILVEPDAVLAQTPDIGLDACHARLHLGRRDGAGEINSDQRPAGVRRMRAGDSGSRKHRSHARSQNFHDPSEEVSRGTAGSPVRKSDRGFRSGVWHAGQRALEGGHVPRARYSSQAVRRDAGLRRVRANLNVRVP